MLLSCVVGGGILKALRKSAMVLTGWSGIRSIKVYISDYLLAITVPEIKSVYVR